jgi:hypothetical protein
VSPVGDRVQSVFCKSCDDDNSTKVCGEVRCVSGRDLVTSGGAAASDIIGPSRGCGGDAC